MLNLCNVDAKQVHISSLKDPNKPSKFPAMTMSNCDGPGRYACPHAGGDNEAQMLRQLRKHSNVGQDPHIIQLPAPIIEEVVKPACLSAC